MRPPHIHPHYEWLGREICIRLLKDELAYSIDFESWKAAQSRDDDKAKFEMQTDEESDQWISRTITEAVGQIRKKLRAYVPERTRMRTDEFTECSEWQIHLLMEPGWTGDADNLCLLMHRYVVDKTLSEWYGIAMPDLQPVYAARAEMDMDDIIDVAREIDLPPTHFML